MIAHVIINITAKGLQKTFTYLVPDSLKERIVIGARVLVPFGTRREEGIVVSTEDELTQIPEFKLKPIQAVLSVQPGKQDEIMATALWISQYYVCNLADALRLFFIEKHGIAYDYEVKLRAEADIPAALTEAERQVLSSVSDRKEHRERDLLCRVDPQALDSLVNKGVLLRSERVLNKIGPKTKKWLRFIKTDVDKILARKKQQARLLSFLEEKKEASFDTLMEAGYGRAVINHLSETDFVEVFYREKETVYLPTTGEKDEKWTLTAEQEAAVQAVETDAISRTWVMRGVTGSGKTEVYMRLAEKVIRKGKQVLLLVPEIALTGQIVRRFTARFANEVTVMHSQLSKGERENNRRRMATGESAVCIGARSAVFTPFADLGLVIIDEEHDSSYKQDEAPRYHAVEVARKRAAYYKAPVILGSATPSVSDYEKALNGEYGLIELKHRVLNRPLPEVEVVDMRQELEMQNYGVLSEKLKTLLKDTLAAKRQAIVLLNRRGFSTFVMCRKCGYVVKCKTCDVPMVYHKQSEHLRCHYCEAVADIPERCPQCGSKYIKFFGAGTERVEAEIRELFPQARVVRLDQDTTVCKNSGDAIIEAFRRHEYDILLGTQMVAKGHDFPDVAAVGILAADSLLNLPAYWAGERTFQLLTQAAGRAGRDRIPGKVVMQTYAPDHYIIKHSRNQDYTGFFKEEIEFRRELAYPPFGKLVKITIIDEDEKDLWRRGNDLYERLNLYAKSEGAGDLEIIGPYVDIIKKIRNKFRIVILIRALNPAPVKAFIHKDKAFWKRGVLIDADPNF